MKAESQARLSEVQAILDGGGLDRRSLRVLIAERNELLRERDDPGPKRRQRKKPEAGEGLPVDPPVQSFDQRVPNARDRVTKGKRR